MAKFAEYKLSLWMETRGWQIFAPLFDPATYPAKFPPHVDKQRQQFVYIVGMRYFPLAGGV